MAHIMIFDDDKSFAESVCRRFKRRIKEEKLNWDIIVQTATNKDDGDSTQFIELGLNTIESLHRSGKPIDLVITDLYMPDIEAGYKVLEKSKSIDPTLMTILYTGRPTELDRERAYKLNVYAIAHRSDPQIKIANELFSLASAALYFREQNQKLCEVQRFADPDVANAMVFDRKAIQMAKHQLTVVFWDIRGFSNLTQRLIAHPEILVDFVAEHCQLARDVIGSHKGILDKFIGDGVMALFGHPIKYSTREQPIARGVGDAISAALEFNRRFNEMAKLWYPQFRKYAEGEAVLPRLGCGIHTAEVLVGFIGTNRGEFTAFGHGVNVASRVQDKAQEHSILATDRVLAWIDELQSTSYFEFREALKDVEFKNIPTKHTLYSVHPK